MCHRMQTDLYKIFTNPKVTGEQIVKNTNHITYETFQYLEISIVRE